MLVASHGRSQIYYVHACAARIFLFYCCAMKHTNQKREGGEKMRKKGEREEICRRGVHFCMGARAILFACIYTRTRGIYMCVCVLRVIRGAIKRRKSCLLRFQWRRRAALSRLRERVGWARAEHSPCNALTAGEGKCIKKLSSCSCNEKTS
jgi:hypothetical protein